MPSASLWSPLVGLAMALAACARTVSPDGAPPAVAPADRTVTVRIVNRSQLDAVVYAVHDGTRDRLGSVTAASTLVVTLRTRTLSSGAFTLVADPVGSRTTTSTELLSVAQGSSFTWTLESDFSRGQVLVQE